MIMFRVAVAVTAVVREILKGYFHKANEFLENLLAELRKTVKLRYKMQSQRLLVVN